MLNKPEVDLLLDKLGTSEKQVSRFELCTVASKRARQIQATRDNVMEKTAFENNALSVACKEIAEGKVIISKD